MSFFVAVFYFSIVMKVKTKLNIKDKEGFFELFRDGLLLWNSVENNRAMPWKGEKDPYKIWLSEIILQQTRVAQGLDYYYRFIHSFPTIHDLASAPDDLIFKHWEGLGYYSRCRNLIHTARYIADELNGKFPDSFESILALKGVGPYTASAISSFAFNLPYAVLDGNVFRVLSRITGNAQPIDSKEGQMLFSNLAQQALATDCAGVYNQAIMDFGATICKPVPSCETCFFNKHCVAYKENRQLALPVKQNKLKIEKRWFHFLILKNTSGYWIRQRTEKDIWHGLYQFPLIETPGKVTVKKMLSQAEIQFGISVQRALLRQLPSTKQRLTHQLIHFSFTEMKVPDTLFIPGYKQVELRTLKSLAFPKTLKEVIHSELQ